MKSIDGKETQRKEVETLQLAYEGFSQNLDWISQSASFNVNEGGCVPHSSVDWTLSEKNFFAPVSKKI
jgi:hypothetical protein